MDLSYHYQMQRILDFEIAEAKGVDLEEHVADRIWALVVELGEAANENRWFKYWSDDQTPRTRVPETAWGAPYKNPLLEEYVDTLKFALSIGIELDIATPEITPRTVEVYELSHAHMQALHHISSLYQAYKKDAKGEGMILIRKQVMQESYRSFMECFIGIGTAYGFSEKDVVRGFFAKHEVNKQRLKEGY